MRDNYNNFRQKEWRESFNQCP